MSRDLEQSLAWAREGQALFDQQVAAFGSEQEWEAPTGLDGWTRKHLVAHVAANAMALVNLVKWARTGEETPMYASPEQRNADIEQGATQGGDDLSSASLHAADRLESDWAELDEQHWAHQVRTAQGRTVAASEVPWMRAREVMVHSVDLSGASDFAGLPVDFCTELADEIVAKRSAAGKDPSVQLTATDADRTWQVTGHGEPVLLSGSAGQVAAYLAGRPTTLTTADGDPAPHLSPWL